MNATGIVRRVDDLGRIAIPKEIRRELGIKEGDALELFRDGKSVVFKKYFPSCFFCEEVDGEYMIGNKPICAKCLADLKKKDVTTEDV